MAHVPTRDQRTAFELPREVQGALGFLQRMLGEFPDPRRPQGRRHPLRTVVVTALMAMLCVGGPPVDLVVRRRAVLKQEIAHFQMAVLGGEEEGLAEIDDG